MPAGTGRKSPSYCRPLVRIGKLGQKWDTPGCGNWRRPLRNRINQMPLVRLGPHQGNPFPSLTLDGWILSKPPELARRAFAPATSMRHNPTCYSYCTLDTSLLYVQVVERAWLACRQQARLSEIP